MAARLALWATAVVFPVPLVILMNVQMDDAGPLRFTISLGLIAYSWWLLAILLSLRPRWLDRRLGLSTIYALHGMLGVAALVPAYLHRENTFAPTELARTLGDVAFWIAVGVLLWSVLFMSGWVTDRSAPVRRARQTLERIFRRRLSLWIHRLNLVVVLLIWLHVHLIERMTQHFEFMVLFDAYTVGALGLYVWKKWVAPDGFLLGTITQNVALNTTTRGITVVLDQPSYASRPGDFYFMRVETPDKASEWHPFSATDAGQKALIFTIRQTGDFTRSLEKIEPGTRVRLEGPFGQFNTVLERQDSQAPVVMLGMGAGVAPLLSLIAGHAHQRRIRLLWSMRQPEDAYYRAELSERQDIANGNLAVTRQIGRFRPEQLQKVLTEEEIVSGTFVLVGPNAAVLAQQRTLRRIGVRSAQIHHERLTM
ncbi:hypothetical protein [Conyzicola sp.]|uniref:hypothetical protein n=1 Tax=Conyzicola sp. TaxID=1969404 RepID=UPI00398948ED